MKNVIVIIFMLSCSGIISQNKIVKSEKIEGFSTFINYTRGYEVDYPDSWEIISQSQNGDGMKIGKTRENISVSLNSSILNDQSFTELYQDSLNTENSIITYKISKDNWFVISGYLKDSEQEFYIKSYLSEKYNEVRWLTLIYPKKNHQEFQNLIPLIIKSFEDI